MSELLELISSSFDHYIFDVSTNIPCIIVGIKDIDQQRIDVQPAIKRVLPDGTLVNEAVIYSVPIIMPATSTSALTFKVNVGDPVLCMFSQRCIDAFKAGNGGIQPPLDLRKFSKRDAVAIIGLFPFSQAPNNKQKRNWSHSTNDTVLVHNIGTSNEVEIRLKEDGGIVINTHSQVEVNASSTVINSSSNTVNGNLTVNGNINCSQTITAATDVVGGGKSLHDHKHKADSDVVCVNGSPWTGSTKAPT